MFEFQYIILALIALLIVAVFILIFVLISNNKNNPSIKQDDSDLKLYLQKENATLRYELFELVNKVERTNEKHLGTFSHDVTTKIDEQLKEINEKVSSKLGEGFNKTDKIFVDFIERLTKIDATQKSLTNLSDEVLNLNQILTDKQSRGAFGEVQLNQILSSVFGNNNLLYEKQKTLSNNKVVDIVVHAPKPLGDISIDSKFPLENYNKMINPKLSKKEHEAFARIFKADVKRHIKDVSEKYIIDNQTAEHAMMFIPAESVFAEIVAFHDDIIQFAHESKVWLVSPTTLISTLTIVQTMYNNMERDKHTEQIISELKLLSTQFKLYMERWEKLKRNAITMTNTINEVSITSKKIQDRFNEISNVEFKDDEVLVNIDN